MSKGVVHFLVPIFVAVIVVVAIAAVALGGSLKYKNGTSVISTILPNKQRDNMLNNPLADHDTYITFSTNAKTWETGKLVKEGASVPELIQLTKDVGQFKSGDLLIYFVDASTLVGGNTEGIGVYRSRDNGKTWASAGSITVANKPNKGGVVDPAVVQLPDGSLRLYYFGSETTTGDPAGVEGPHNVYSATSTNGLNWKVESGIRFSDEHLTDPEVIFYNNKWYMYYSAGPETKLATATDGLIFTSQNITGGGVGGVPGAVEVNGGVRLYGCSQGISTAFSATGTSFGIDGTNIVKGEKPVVCDPSVVKLQDGRYAMAFKVAQPNENMGSPPEGGQPPMPPQ